jgi:hypothetical protein
MRNLYEILIGKHERKRLLGKLRHRWGIKFKQILGKYGLRVWTGLIWLMIRTGDRILKSRQ